MIFRGGGGVARVRLPARSYRTEERRGGPGRPPRAGARRFRRPSRGSYAEDPAPAEAEQPFTAGRPEVRAESPALGRGRAAVFRRPSRDSYRVPRSRRGRAAVFRRPSRGSYRVPASRAQSSRAPPAVPREGRVPRSRARGSGQLPQAAPRKRSSAGSVGKSVS
nr:uncharacterized protein LOC117683471 [Crassostrea gigas]